MKDSKEIKLPNFLIVGAAKCGTTSLYYYLKEHPEIFLSNKKELRFLSSMPGNFKGPGDDLVNNTITKSFSEYIKNFSEAKSEKVIGDVSPDYLYYYKISIENAKKYLDNPRIIIILRNPIDRAFSQYLHFLRDGRECLSFEESLEAAEKRKEDNWEWAWQYLEVGFYYKQVKAYIDNFSEVKIYLYDDLLSSPLKLIQDIYSFLGVNPTFVPDLGKKYNVSLLPKNYLLHAFLTQPNLLKTLLKPLLKIFFSDKRLAKLVENSKARNLYKPKMKEETRRYLISLYHNDILQLQKLINRDLSHWLS